MEPNTYPKCLYYDEEPSSPISRIEHKLDVLLARKELVHFKRMWINQPSTLQRYHTRHGENVLVDFSENLHSNAVTVYFLKGSIISQIMSKNALSLGWKYTKE